MAQPFNPCGAAAGKGIVQSRRPFEVQAGDRILRRARGLGSESANLWKGWAESVSRLIIFSKAQECLWLGEGLGRGCVFSTLTPILLFGLITFFQYFVTRNANEALNPLPGENLADPFLSSTYFL